MFESYSSEYSRESSRAQGGWPVPDLSSSEYLGALSRLEPPGDVPGKRRVRCSRSSDEPRAILVSKLEQFSAS